MRDSTSGIIYDATYIDKEPFIYLQGRPWDVRYSSYNGYPVSPVTPFSLRVEKTTDGVIWYATYLLSPGSRYSSVHLINSYDQTIVIGGY